MSDEGRDKSDGQSSDHQLTTWIVIGIAIVLIAALFGVRFEHQPETTRDYPSRPLMADAAAVLMEAPEIDDEYLPCSDCHAGREVRPEVREMDDEHDLLELDHGQLWCLHCHDAGKEGYLRLADETRIEMEESWRLCVQCHGDKLQDWRDGVHGKRTGNWRGAKEYRTCVVCHEPHAPAWKPIEPKPRPRRPDEIGRAIEAAVAHEEHDDEHS